MGRKAQILVAAEKWRLEVKEAADRYYAAMREALPIGTRITYQPAHQANDAKHVIRAVVIHHSDSVYVAIKNEQNGMTIAVDPRSGEVQVVGEEPLIQ